MAGIIYKTPYTLIVKLPRRWGLPWLHLQMGRTTFTQCGHHPTVWGRLPIIVRAVRQAIGPDSPCTGWNIWVYLRDGRAWCHGFVIDRRQMAGDPQSHARAFVRGVVRGLGNPWLVALQLLVAALAGALTAFVW